MAETGRISKMRDTSAAERRKPLAHGASRGMKVIDRHSRGVAKERWNPYFFRPIRGSKISCQFPRLTPWAEF